MHTRKTSDYSPIRPGSKAEQQAINARAEMLKVLGGRNHRLVVKTLRLQRAKQRMLGAFGNKNGGATAVQVFKDLIKLETRKHAHKLIAQEEVAAG